MGRRVAVVVSLLARENIETLAIKRSFIVVRFCVPDFLTFWLFLTVPWLDGKVAKKTTISMGPPWANLRLRLWPLKLELKAHGFGAQKPMQYTRDSDIVTL